MTISIGRCRCALGAACAATLLLAPGASGGLMYLSTNSSDSTPASVLNAMYEFDVTGSTLTFTAHNQTADPAAYRINQLYFNAGADVTGLTPVSIPSGWSYQNNVAANGFGRFHHALIGGVGQSQAQILHGDSLTFVFTIHGAGVAEDFMSTYSSIPPGGTPSIVAAKFVGGPNDGGAYGATVPAPGVAGALLFGAACLGGRRRR